MLARLPHPLNADEPIATKFDGNVIDCKYEQFSNALESILVTVLGIVILAKLPHPLNAELPILVIKTLLIIEGISIFPFALNHVPIIFSPESLVLYAINLIDSKTFNFNTELF